MQTSTQPKIGVGLRHPHYEAALASPQDIDFVEFHAENLFTQSDLQQQFIVDVVARWDVSLHGTAFGLGSVPPPATSAMQALQRLIKVTQPILVSEHVCFNRAMVHGTLFHGGDLYPLPYNDATLDVLCQHIDIMQEQLQRPILLENLSAYLDDIEHEYTESEFLSLMVRRTGCGLLLDLNNILVNEYNSNQPPSTPLDNAMRFIRELPAHTIQEIHLAGFTPKQVNGKYIDDHAQSVSPECWELYTLALEHTGVVPTLIEWDNNLPDWSVLQDQAKLARKISLAHMQTTDTLA
ncbi:MAG: DUF692 domain-containing protein [Glaciecola sp.]|jgi:uncharacterized protein|nr:DUF692 domain-containing protein [Glaciecola sp.]MDG1816508.1 DUF692 domain-containing protein [Glaciecola sp.]MDG2098773.1 DUF692 domain-containing protein [Glaciecola sp.]